MSFRRKTHCKRGHEFTEENTYVRANGSRTCWLCKKRYNRTYYVNNTDKCKELSRKWEKENPERAKVRSRNYWRSDRGREIRRRNFKKVQGTPLDKARNKIRKYRRRAKEGVKFRTPRGKALAAFLQTLPEHCVECGSRYDLEVDHIMPLSKGGAPLDFVNLTVRCKPCNVRKSDRLECG